MKIKITVVFSFVTLFFIVFNLSFESYFDPFSDVPMASKPIIAPLGLTAIVPAILLIILASFIVYHRLNIVENYLRNGKGEEKARHTLLRLPILLIALSVVFWQLGNLLYFILGGFWDGKNDIRMIVSHLYLLPSGILSGIALWNSISGMILDLKNRMGITEIHDHEKDFFAVYRTVISTMAFVAWAMGTMLYVLGAYVNEAGKSGKVLSLVPAFVITFIMLVIGSVVLWSQSRDKTFQVRNIETQLKDVLDAKEETGRLLTIINFDEFGRIVNWQNKLITRFRSMIEQIRQSGGGFSDLVTSLSASSAQIASGSAEQAVAVREVVSTMDETNDAVKTVGDKMLELYNYADATNDLVIDSMNTLNSYAGQMDEIRQSNLQTIESISRLEEEISTVSDIIGAISKIADQTRIIAFNAELEASAAGEQGQSFEIVAYEIRRLADNTMNFTSSIVERMREFQRLSSSIGALSRGNTAKINKGWELTEKVNSSFTVIHDNSNMSSELANDVTASMNEMVESFRMMILTLKQISLSIDNFSESTRSLNKAADTVRSSADILNQLVR